MNQFRNTNGKKLLEISQSNNTNLQWGGDLRARRQRKLVHLTSRTKAKAEIKAWQQNNNRKHIPAMIVAKAMYDNYHFAQFSGSGQISAPLMFYVDDKNNDYYGTYVIGKEQLENEISKVCSNLNISNNIKNIIIYIRARCQKITDNLPEQRNMVAVNNGIYDFKTKKLIPFDPKYIFTSKVHTNYNPSITSPVINGWSFDKFLEDAVGKKQLKLVWQMINNALNSNVPSNKVFIFKGNSYGRNGKSTFEDALGYVISGGQNLNRCDTVATTKMTDFGEPFGLSALPGTLLDIGDNVDSHARINSKACENLHSLITGDPVDVNIKNQNLFSLMYHGLIIQSSNGLPKYADNNGMLRRTEVITFNHTFKSGNDQIKTDYIKRTNVREYILKKALSLGLVRKYHETKETKQANVKLINNSDKVRMFATKVFPKMYLTCVPCIDLFHIYLAWCDDNNSDTDMTKQTFSERFKDATDGKFEYKTCRLSHKMRERLQNGIDNVDFDIPSRLLGLSGSGYTARCWNRLNK